MDTVASAQTLTFLFTDIEGSTPLWDSNPGAMRVATERHNALLREAIAAHNGQAFRVVGDAFCVAFSDADSALKTAIDAQRALTAQSWDGAPIRVRMGLHSGAVEATEDEIFRGAALARAARVMSAAHGEQILVTAATIALLDASVSGGATLRDLGDHTLRGFARPERVYQLVVPGLRAEFPPIRTREALRSNLPPSLTSFVGRESAIAAVREHVRASRMVTLTGSGGTGKTRLMLEAAGELLDTFPDGVWLVELASVADAAQLTQTIAAALGARAEGDVPAQTLVESALAGKRSLLLLDNCEHIVDEAARVARSLLRALPQLHLLATSREALGTDGEVVYRVPSLTLPVGNVGASVDGVRGSEAARLFIDRATAVVPEFALTEKNAAAVAQICLRLDGIPLALELAAARMTALSVEELAARLHDRFRILTGGQRTALPRQRTLRALVDWSYELLSPDERSVLMTVAVFAGGFSLGGAESVCEEHALREITVLDAIEHLVAKSLLVAEHNQGGETRYRLLEIIRQYAAEKLADAGRADDQRRRHFEHFLALAQRGKAALRGPAALEWLDRLEAEHDNLRAALDWSGDVEPTGYARLAGVLGEFWDIRGHFAEGFARLERALALHAEEDTIQLAALVAAGSLSYRLDHWPRSEALLGEAVALAARLGDARCEAEATIWRTVLAASSGRVVDAVEALAQRAYALCVSVNDAWGIAVATSLFGLAALMRERPVEAERFYLESARDFDRIGSELKAALVRTFAGQCAIERLDFDAARPLLESALSEHRRVGNIHDAGTTLWSLGRLALNEGRLEDASRFSEESVKIFRGLHDKNCGANAATTFAEVLHATGEHALAMRHAQDAQTAWTELELHYGCARALSIAGRIHEAQSAMASARRSYLMGLRELMHTPRNTALPGLLEGVAGILPRATVAPRLLGAAAALREGRVAAVYPSERADVDRRYASVRAAHSASDFDREFALGRTMTRAEAIECALELGAHA